jgi:triacylglycerol lipase
LTKFRTFAAVMLGAGVLVAASCTVVPPTGNASAKTPVVLVHGFIEGNIIWGTMQDSLKARGYTTGDITNHGYDTTGSGAASSAQTASNNLGKSVDDAIAYSRSHGNPGATKVDIISHSYGGLVTRYCIELGPCAGKVNHWVSLAGADGGTSIASIPALLGEGSGVDMSINSPTVMSLKSSANVQKLLSQGVKVHVWWSNNDGIISPAVNSQWPSPEAPNAANNTRNDNVNHLNIFNDAGVIGQVVQFLGT